MVYLRRFHKLPLKEKTSEYSEPPRRLIMAPHSAVRRLPSCVVPCLLIAIFSLAGSLPQVFAQQFLCSIEGSVTDLSVAAIPRVDVKAVNLDTHLELTA